MFLDLRNISKLLHTLAVYPALCVPTISVYVIENLSFIRTSIDLTVMTQTFVVVGKMKAFSLELSSLIQPSNQKHLVLVPGRRVLL